MLSTEQVSQIATRVIGGEGVNSIIESMGLDLHSTLVELRDYHKITIQTAKRDRVNILDEPQDKMNIDHVAMRGNES
jgi:hypothetical protein